jgi:hypothetical protein
MLQINEDYFLKLNALILFSRGMALKPQTASRIESEIVGSSGQDAM